ncbi:MAG: sulfur oxidation c-type cytochrome SoxX [Campylobacterales bacterium]|nr:sulfur oxidation c-type cytochrome SoxX [Campylobacterales bacterium]
MKKSTVKTWLASSTAAAMVMLSGISSGYATEIKGAAFDAETLKSAEQTVNESWTRSTPEERKRLVQDYSNKVCSAYKDKPTPELAAKIKQFNKELINYPQEGIKLGDWKNGAKLARSGYGMRIGKIHPDTGKKPNGGNCYACHALDPNEPAAGNLGPKLTGYGARGTSEPIMKYTYEKIYNAHAFYACSGMPRFGVHNVLTSKQIADIMAYLMDPKSPVNQK